MRNDLGYAIRNLARNPGLTAVAVLTLALGIGANTAMFSVINAVLLRPLPYPQSDRLVTILAGIPSLNIEGAFVEYNTFGEWWKSQSRSFESMWAYNMADVNLTSAGEPERLQLCHVNAGFLAMIGLRPVLGREFLPEEDQPGAARVSMLSNGIWKRRFGSDPAIIGRQVVLDNQPYTVVGVMPPGLDFYSRDTEVYAPIAASTARVPSEPTVGVHARLKPGVSLETAQAEIDSLSRRFAEQYHYPNGWGARVWQLRDHRVRNVRWSVVVLSVAVAMVLLIACANIANLLLARAGTRSREIAIRRTLGAGRGRIIRQLLTEGALLGVLGGVAGLLLAWAGVRTLLASQVKLPAVREIAVDLPVLGFTAAAILLTTLLFALAPAIAVSGGALSENLKEGGRVGEGASRSRFRDLLVVSEIALALLLVTGTSLMVRSLIRILSVDPGFNAERVLTASLTLPAANYGEPARRVNFFNALLERLRATPGVQSASMVSHLPFSYSKSGQDVNVEGAAPVREGERVIAFGRTVDPDYFATLQVRLIKGRYFSPRDPAGGPVAIINETLARQCWPNQDPVGSRFALGRGTWINVVGVIGDMRQTSLAERPDAEYYMPYMQRPGPSMALVLRTGADPQLLASGIQAAVRELDKDLPVADIATLAGSVSDSTSTQRLSTVLLGIFAFLALLLAVVGIYGVMSHAVTRRTHEIGVRMALGAERNGIALMVIGRALLLGAAGVGLGLAGSWASMRLLRTMLYGVSPTDPAVFTGGSLFLLALAALAGYLPARRAARVDPVVALRDE